MPSWLLNLLTFYFFLLPFGLMTFAPASAALGVVTGTLISWSVALVLALYTLPRDIAAFLDDIERHRRRRRP